MYTPRHTIEIETWDDSRIWNRSVGMREVVVMKYEIGKEVKLPMEPVIGCTCTLVIRKLAIHSVSGQ